MNTGQLMTEVAKTAGLDKGQARNAVLAVLHTIQSEVCSGNKVTLAGFGSFTKTKRAARQGRNPQTGDPVKIAAKNAPKFAAGRVFKEVVNKVRELSAPRIVESAVAVIMPEADKAPLKKIDKKAKPAKKARAVKVTKKAKTTKKAKVTMKSKASKVTKKAKVAMKSKAAKVTKKAKTTKKAKVMKKATPKAAMKAKGKKTSKKKVTKSKAKVTKKAKVSPKAKVSAKKKATKKPSKKKTARGKK